MKRASLRGKLKRAVFRKKIIKTRMVQYLIVCQVTIKGS